ncbi:uncharacterized protein LOC106180921 [Lingula anatina]|uniref:Uncharacterized protein LOC106180921 n=1 Tax=Lingula anatina TaxID=7574 RepID=A0A1S3KD45_LINAN|nr:uncharacterized protein LOC106180921 [Lingula anatina]|eukprot:XP_013420548.1 uncharacterized protein LOC106180921 [Lingula anatina]
MQVSSDLIQGYCQQGDLEALQLSLSGISQKDIRNLLSKKNTAAGTALFEAIVHQRTEIVDFLLNQKYCDLEQECDVDIEFCPLPVKGICTALYLAILVDNEAIVKSLLEAGASATHRTKRKTPLFLIADSAGLSVNLLHLLVHHGADVNEKLNGWNVLHAVCHNHRANFDAANVKKVVQFVRALAEYGLDINAQSDCGCTPVEEACKTGCYLVGKWLLEQRSLKVTERERIRLWLQLGAACILHNAQLIYHQCLVSRTLKCWKKALKVADVSHCTDAFKHLPDFIVEFKDSEDFQGTCNEILLSISPFRDKDTLRKLGRNFRALEQQALALRMSLNVEPTKSKLVLGELLHEASRVVDQDMCLGIKLFIYSINLSLEGKFQNQCEEALSFLMQYALHKFTTGKISNNSDAAQYIDPLIAMINLINKLMRLILELTPICGEKDDSNFLEQIENLMGILGMLHVINSKTALNPSQKGKLIHSLSTILEIEDQVWQTFEINLNWEFIRIASYNVFTARSTLYFFQEALYPSILITDWLVKAGIDVNVKDKDGTTPLIFCLKSLHPDKDFIIYFIMNGAHVDVENRYGENPYDILMAHPELGISPFEFMTLKCLAARTIIKQKLRYNKSGMLPKNLLAFVQVHEKCGHH